MKLVPILQQVMLENKINILYDFIKSTIRGSEWEDKVYAVGGFTRDRLMDIEPKDLDIMVDAPNGGIEFANWITKKLGVYKENSNPVIYPKFGTAKFNFRGITFRGQDLSDLDIESVMPRGETYTAGSRKPETFFTTLTHDAERRDLTINALFQRLSDDEILDLTGKGKDDLKNKLIRTPLDPDFIFAEDPLRMLRVIRFAVKYGFGLQLSTIKALKRNAEKLKDISEERIMVELNNMLLTKNPAQAIRLLKISNLYNYIIPELNDIIDLKQNKYHDQDAFGHTLTVLNGVPANIITRLSALFHDIGKGQTKSIIDNEIHFYEHEFVGSRMAREILTRLKYPNDIIEPVVAAIKNHMRFKSTGQYGEKLNDKTLRKFKHDLGDHLETVLDLMDSDNKAHGSHSMPDQVPGIRSRISKLKDLPSTGQHLKLPINGNDIMQKFGVKKGVQIGELIDVVKDKFFEDPDMTRDEAFEIVKNELNK